MTPRCATSSSRAPFALCFHRAAMSQVAFYCLPAAVGLWFLPAPLRHLILYSSGLPFAETWRTPRAASKLRPNHDLLQRCEAVHANALEGLVMFFGSVLAAVVAGVPSEQVDTAAVTYVASRVAYTAVYLASSPKRRWLGPVRTLCFAAGFTPVLFLFFAAAARRA